MSSSPVLTTDIPGLPKFITGKVRDVYDAGDSLLLIATDRISAFDVVLPSGIPDKGRVLTQMSVYWFERTADIVPNHLISAEIDDIAAHCERVSGEPWDAALRQTLAGRSLLVQKCSAFPVECVVRGFLSGSAWKDYRSIFSHGGEVNLHGNPVRVGLTESDRFDFPIFTPATKAHTGHDENVTAEEAGVVIGADVIQHLETLSIQLYTRAFTLADAADIIIADTKFEFGRRPDNTIILIDEALTPDSSRFWEKSTFQPGQSQPSFDKQYVRDYLETLDWDKTEPGPELPAEVVEKTAEKYRDAYRRITGRELTV